MDLQVILLLIAALLFAVALSQPLADRIALSPSVLLALVGMAIGLTSMILTRAGSRVEFASVASVIVHLPIHSDAFLYIFLPMLVFEAGLNIEVRRMMEDAAPILMLAVVAVLVSTLFVGAALTPLAAVPAVACFMLASMVATTDPVAVIAIFRDVGAPSRLSRLVEGESLLNDAAAITLFVMLIGNLIGGNRLGLGGAVVSFVRSFAGGVAIGYVGGRLVVGVLRWLLDMRRSRPLLGRTCASPPFGDLPQSPQVWSAKYIAAVITANAAALKVAITPIRTFPQDGFVRLPPADRS
jgi:CPA1 family monovalent cation:H+ antiporter